MEQEVRRETANEAMGGRRHEAYCSKRRRSEDGQQPAPPGSYKTGRLPAKKSRPFPAPKYSRLFSQGVLESSTLVNLCDALRVS